MGPHLLPCSAIFVSDFPTKLVLVPFFVLPLPELRLKVAPHCQVALCSWTVVRAWAQTEVMCFSDMGLLLKLRCLHRNELYESGLMGRITDYYSIRRNHRNHITHIYGESNVFVCIAPFQHTKALPCPSRSGGRRLPSQQHLCSATCAFASSPRKNVDHEGSTSFRSLFSPQPLKQSLDN